MKFIDSNPSVLINFTDAKSYIFPEEFTISVWLKPDSEINSTLPILQKANRNYESQYLKLDINASNYLFSIRNTETNLDESE